MMTYHHNDPKHHNMCACAECGHIKTHMLTLKIRGAHHEMKTYLCLECLYKGVQIIEDMVDGKQVVDDHD